MNKIMLFAAVALLVACSAEREDMPAAPLDILLVGGMLYSGADEPPLAADVGIMDDRIVAIGELEGRSAALTLDVSGLAVLPGFVDIHSHAVRDELNDGIFRWPDAENLIRQGVTTVVGGPDGSSPLPVTDTFAALAADPAAVNFATFVGHGSIRSLVVGEDDRPASDVELEQMREQVRFAMESGAFGLSSGLIYAPGRFAETDEVIELARVAGEFGGIYISHMREEGLAVLDSVAETIRIGEEGGLPTQITHHKIVGAPMWGQSTETLRLVDEAVARGVDVSIDQYPYTASSTSLTILFPGWSLDGGRAALLARLDDSEQRQRLKSDIVYNIEMDRGGDDPANVVIANCPHDNTLNGLNLSDILRLQERGVSHQNAAELLMELVYAGNCSAVFHAIDEDDVRRIMQHDRTMIASDGGIEGPSERVPHPRNYGTFARVLGHYARDEGVLPQYTAIHKMSMKPADRINMHDRGRVAIGAVADIAVIDLNTVIDRSTFEAPHRYAHGVQHVFVNGQPVLLDGEMTGARPGRVLLSGDYR
ncbi:MAG: N-acyl-D-amino-acid deacylase [Gammaproteobacteria bacterium]|nr:N-acyl-D-amino-acid deacylase [Gammaproteobacteria bacterium]|tara:strand:- start:3986 stop:5596 length:1611 start_codon:yes stop_codon:yes gene_type:complete